MATGVWTFSVLPDTITTIYVDGFQITRSTTSPYKFIIDGYSDGTIVTISATGYNSKSVTVGESSITLTPALQEMSKLSNGTDTYAIRDDEARSILTTKQDTIDSSNKLSASLISGLSTVATSGSYNDLSNKPTIPTTTSSVTSGSTAALTSGGAYTALQSYQTTANLVTSVSSSSTDSQYPSAKLFYDTCGDIETLINAL